MLLHVASLLASIIFSLSIACTVSSAAGPHNRLLSSEFFLDQSENIIKHLGSFNNLISFNYGHFMSFWFIAAHEWPKGRILNDMISSYPMRGEGNSCGARRVDSNIEHAHSSYKKNFLTAQLANHRSPQNLQTKCLHQAYIQNILTTYSGLSLEQFSNVRKHVIVTQGL